MNMNMRIPLEEMEVLKKHLKLSDDELVEYVVLYSMSDPSLGMAAESYIKATKDAEDLEEEWWFYNDVHYGALDEESREALANDTQESDYLEEAYVQINKAYAQAEEAGRKWARLLMASLA